METISQIQLSLNVKQQEQRYNLCDCDTMQNINVELSGLRSPVSVAGEICGSSGVQPFHPRARTARASSGFAYVNSTKMPSLVPKPNGRYTRCG